MTRGAGSASSLAAPTSALRGVGPAVQAKLAKRGLNTVGDLLFLVPRAYEDRRQVIPISQLEVGARAVVSGEVAAAGASGGGRFRRYEIAIDDDSGVLRLVFFNFNPHRMRLDYRRGERLWAFGQVSLYRGQRQMAHPEISRQDGGDREQGVVGVYPEVSGLHRRTVRKIVMRALDDHLDALEDSIVPARRRALGLAELGAAIRALHRPGEEDWEAIRDGRSPFQERLAFDEFFHLQVALAQRRHAQQSEPAPSITLDAPLSTLARELLPFTPTAAQARVLEETGADLVAPRPMARLLQGDVGSGKTAVAAVAALAVVRSGHQVALLVPTEILAEQHRRTLRRMFEPLGVEVGLLTGSTRAKERREILAALAEGTLPLLIGTHALLQPDVELARLGLVIIDEQHRFGVRQRAALAGRGAPLAAGGRTQPHQLVMTATPIPRSLSLTLYGDLELSVIDELPPGRRPVRTTLLSARARAALRKQIQGELDAGGQVFMVYPLVEESEKLDLADATAGAAEMERWFPDGEVALITGRMSGRDKEAVMRAFAAGERRVLVATTVVEVGVDVPQATLMVVVNAERFGLSQLHQLRGRVGRGEQPASCLLVHSGEGGEEAWRRLKVMEETTDGFRIAEEDLAIRGPGDVLGTRQAGLPTLAFADLVRHGRLLEQARRAAQEVVAEDPFLRAPENAALKRALEGRFRERLEIIRGG